MSHPCLKVALKAWTVNNSVRIYHDFDHVIFTFNGSDFYDQDGSFLPEKMFLPLEIESLESLLSSFKMLSIEEAKTLGRYCSYRKVEA